MSTITKEWLQQKIAGMEARRDDPWLGLDEDDSNTLAALRIALASLEAEPVCVTDELAKRIPEILRTGKANRWEIQALAKGCRAAMLQSAYGTLTNEGTIPDNTSCKLREGVAAIRNSGIAIDAEKIKAERDALNSPAIPDWQAKAERMAELHGSSFVLFRNGESPQCADPTKVIISFTDEGLGHGSAAPQQE